MQPRIQVARIQVARIQVARIQVARAVSPMESEGVVHNAEMKRLTNTLMKRMREEYYHT